MPRILIVEDSATQAEEIRLILEAKGFTVEVTPDAYTALQQVRGGQFELILTDVVMPGMTGYDLCRRLKTDPATKSIPVVLLTQLNGPLDIMQGLESGADNFITKPVDADYLVRRIQGILGAHPPKAGTSLSFRGKGVTVTADKEQILDLLLATVEDFVRAREREREMAARRDLYERQAGDLAEAGRRKDDFLAMLAHELKNPLGPILTGIHIARAGSEAVAKERALESVERQATHLSRLMDDLLNVDRLMRGKVELRPERLDLARLVRRAAEDRRPLLEKAGLVLAVETPATPVWVQGDATRLAQAVDNLLDNAGKFTERDGQVVVRLAVDEGAQKARLTVKDTGKGIEPEMLGRVWEVFTQATCTLGRSRGGLGLGLSIVRELVALHGGEVQATSAGAGQGAEFSILLPVEHEPPALSREAPAQPAAHGSRVLVVEDNRDAADSLKMLLRLMGHDTRVAYTGPEGLKTATEWVPDLVLCDIGLPGLDGYGVARALRMDPKTNHMRLLALTGYGSDEDRRLSREAGFDEHLTKPVAPQVLQEYLVKAKKP